MKHFRVSCKEIWNCLFDAFHVLVRITRICIFTRSLSNFKVYSQYTNGLLRTKMLKFSIIIYMYKVEKLLPGESEALFNIIQSLFRFVLRQKCPGLLRLRPQDLDRLALKRNISSGVKELYQLIHTHTHTTQV